MFVRMEISCFTCITNIWHFFLFYVENAPKMRRMRKLENYADPHHRILTDALIYVEAVPQNSKLYPFTQTFTKRIPLL